MAPLLATRGAASSTGFGRFFSPTLGSFESIATVTVTSSSAADIGFTSIPGTYTHLQVRGILRSTYGSDQPSLALQINGSYIDRNHNLYGEGSSATGYTGTGGNISHSAGANSGSNVFSAIIIDILDYANTNKYRTVRALSGGDRNGSGFIELCSGLEQTTSAVTSITLVSGGANIAQYSTLALYGIKGA